MGRLMTFRISGLLLKTDRNLRVYGDDDLVGDNILCPHGTWTRHALSEKLEGMDGVRVPVVLSSSDRKDPDNYGRRICLIVPSDIRILHVWYIRGEVNPLTARLYDMAIPGSQTMIERLGDGGELSITEIQQLVRSVTKATEPEGVDQ